MQNENSCILMLFNEILAEKKTFPVARNPTLFQTGKYRIKRLRDVGRRIDCHPSIIS